MSRSVKASNLEGLRTRITTLFLQYIKTPAFNPEVAKYLKVIVGQGVRGRAPSPSHLII